MIFSNIGTDLNFIFDKFSVARNLILNGGSSYLADRPLVTHSYNMASVRTLLKITLLASRKSYLVIICPNSHEMLTKIKIISSWSRFKDCSE